MQSYDNLKLRDALLRQRLRQALGLPEEKGTMDPATYALILKKKRLSSILRQQMKEAGMGDLSKMVKFKKERR